MLDFYSRLALMSAAIFGNVSSIMLRMYQGTEEYQEKQVSIKEFIKFHRIPTEMGARLLDSFNHTWQNTSGMDMNSVLKAFPDCLQADVCLHLNRNLLMNNNAFKHASPGCLRVLSKLFKSTHAPPGDTLTHQSELLTSIYFIARGSMEVVKNDVVMAVLGRGDTFGDSVADFDPLSPGKSQYSVRALSYCDLHKIELQDLYQVMQAYPEFAEKFIHKFRLTFNLRTVSWIFVLSSNFLDFHIGTPQKKYNIFLKLNYHETGRGIQY